MMKNSISRILLVIIFLLASFCPIEASAASWQMLKGEHFIVYFLKDTRWAKEILNKAEDYYNKIADDLGYTRYSEFWAWDNRVKIYIYPDRDSYISYVDANDYAKWSSGMVKYEEKEIISYAQSEEFLRSTLPHEITHLIFRDYVGERNIPVWIDEGVAQWEEEWKREFVKRKMKKLLEAHEPIDMGRMMMLQIGLVDNEAIVELYYVQAISLVDFLITEHGGKNFIFFCRYLRDGKDLNEALKFTYPTSIRSVDILMEKWLEYMEG